jgi:hypothetical protein
MVDVVPVGHPPLDGLILAHGLDAAPNPAGDAALGEGTKENAASVVAHRVISFL